MSLLESTKIPLGTEIPSFTLNDPEGTLYTSDQFFDKTKGLLVAFTCNHCPYAIAIWPRLIKLAEHAKSLNIETIAINPNINPDYPEDSPESMINRIEEWNIKFPYLVDNLQETAKEFKAQCTPDLYLFNSDKKLVYHGRIDDNWKDEAKVTKHELSEAINNLAEGNPISENQKPTIGCSIKWV